MHDLRILSPRLPYRTRARLRVQYYVDGLGGWFAGHGHCRTAEWLWRACGMW